MDFPAETVTPLFIHSYSRFTAAYDGVRPTSVGNLTWVANLAVYVPLALPFPYIVRRVWWHNGNATGNVDVGFYNADGVRLYSTGATAQSGANAPQYVTPTAFLLPAGRYYMAMMQTSASASLQLGVAATAINMRIAGVLQEATGGTLPTTMTPAAIANALYPIFGFTKTASGF